MLVAVMLVHMESGTMLVHMESGNLASPSLLWSVLYRNAVQHAMVALKRRMYTKLGYSEQKAELLLVKYQVQAVPTPTARYGFTVEASNWLCFLACAVLRVLVPS